VEEFWGYCETVLVAAKTSPEAFANSARANPHLAFAHLHRDPARYRGKVLHIEGWLGRLLRFDAPEYLRFRGVRYLYEAWVFSGNRNTNPYCVHFLELPPGIQTGENIAYPIAFDGYFFKKLRYSAAKEDRYTSLFIARTINRKRMASESASFSNIFVIAFCIVIGGTVLVVVGLTWWFSRGDRRLRSRLTEALPQPAFENAVPELPDPAPGGRGPTAHDKGPEADRGFRRNGH
jgi:hypothetical protein